MNANCKQKMNGSW